MKGVISMGMFGITITFIIGLLILIVGAVPKKKVLMIISIIPLSIAIFQILMLLILFL